MNVEDTILTEGELEVYESISTLSEKIDDVGSRDMCVEERHISNNCSISRPYVSECLSNLISKGVVKSFKSLDNPSRYEYKITGGIKKYER